MELNKNKVLYINSTKKTFVFLCLKENFLLNLRFHKSVNQRPILTGFLTFLLQFRFQIRIAIVSRSYDPTRLGK